MSDRPYHHGNLRAALLDAAEQTVSERGAGALSLRELAREVGVSHAAPRRHFADRQALLEALAQEGFDRLAGELARAAEDAGEDFAKRLRAVAGAYVRFATEDAALLELMFAAKHREEAVVLRESAEGAFAVMLDLISQGQREGLLARGDPERVGLVLFATIQGIASMISAGLVSAAQAPELLADAIANFLAGSRASLKTRASRASA